MPTQYYTTEPTLSSTGGTNISGQTAEIIISNQNPETQLSTGYFIQAKNFIIGGATETNGSGVATSGTNIYEGGNVDTGISKVTFTDLGDPINSPGQNDVKATVTFGTVSPAADQSFHIDIDEKTSDPITLLPSRKVCFFLKVKYNLLWTHKFYVPVGDGSSWTEASNPYANITRTLLNPSTFATDGFYRYKFEGDIVNYSESADYSVTRVAFLRSFDASTTIDALPTGPTQGVLTATNYNHILLEGSFSLDVSGEASSPYYSSEYNIDMNEVLSSYTNSVGSQMVVPMAYWYDISVNPIDESWAIEDDDIKCDMGHTIELNVFALDPPGPSPLDGNPIIKSVQIPNYLDNNSGYRSIVVRGTPGAEYKINLIESQNLTSATPATSNGYYNFSSLNAFQTAQPENVFTLSSRGVNSHQFLIPKISSEKRYDVTVTGHKDTSVDTKVNTYLSNNFINKKAPYTITINATATTGLFDLTGSAASFVIKKRASASGYSNAISHTTVEATLASAVSSSTRLELTSTPTNIDVGMYVITPMGGTGIPHKTTVTDVNNNIITVSANCTLASGAELRFDSDDTGIYPFTLVCPAGGSAGSFKNLAAIADDNASYDPAGSLITGSGILNSATTSGSSTTVQLDSSRDIQRAQVGMFLASADISTPDGNFVEITANEGVGGGSKGQIAIASAQTLTADSEVSVVEDPRVDADGNPTATSRVSAGGVILVHAQATITTSSGDPANNQEVATVTGYLQCNQTSRSSTIPFYIETMLTST